MCVIAVIVIFVILIWVGMRLVFSVCKWHSAHTTRQENHV
jgi:hypothetical protein